MNPTAPPPHPVTAPAHAATDGNRPPPIPRPVPPPICASPRIARLTADLAAGRAGALPAFWAEVAAAGTPLAEPPPDGGGGVVLTFLWRSADAAEVVLLANKLADRHDPAASRMRRLGGADVWHLSYRLPADWRGSYHVAVRAAPGGRPTLHPDPHNADRLPQSAGPPRSIAEAPAAAAAPRWWEPRPGTPAGAIAPVAVDGRRVWRYLPPAGGSPAAAAGGDATGAGPLPVLVLLDGDIWGPLLPVAPLLDNLIHAGRLPPLAALLPDSGGPAARAADYTCSEAYADWLAALVPAALGDRATADPDRTIIAGQSLGGLAAVHAGLRAPHRFGRVLAQSGAFWWPSAPAGAAEWLTRYVAATPRRPIRLHFEVGTDEWVNRPPLDRLRAALAARGYPVTHREFAGGHDRACWRADLADALTTLHTDP
ncbi:enterochelin esterase [Pilimelia anulata]|uniref:Enterochelin esterase n=1 Tax=Pilimelia anulata TaxID=53371 RepID=A0A8J3BC38_9ACTN|nr:enterochelin esterase [Pilimelia anulata]